MKMKLPRLNIESRLRKYRDRQVSQADLMNEVYKALLSEPREITKIHSQLSSKTSKENNTFKFEQLEADRIYHLDQIREICIEYRLRFLDSSYFKGELPHQAIFEIERLQQAHDTELSGFKIMAPSRLFKLEDKDDPLLFAPIGNGYYYLIHKWGNDLHPLRKLLVWPFKNLVNLTILVLLISYLATVVVPDGIFSRNSSNAEFWLIFFFMFKSVGAVVIFYGFALGKNFNSAIWNSKYFNA